MVKGKVMVKNIFAVLLSLTLILNPISTLAEGNKEKKSKTKQEVAQQVQSTIYDLKHLGDVLKDMDDIYERVAPAGYSKSIVLELNRRLNGAQQLISEILLDKKMSDEKKDEYLSQLVPEFGKAWFKVYYDRQGDAQDDPRLKDYSGVPEVRELMAEIQKTQKGSNDWSDLQDELRGVLDGLQAEKAKPVSNDSPFVKLLRNAKKFVVRPAINTGFEFIKDLKAVFSYRVTANMERAWTMMSRSYQDVAARDGLRTLANMTVNTLPKMEQGDILDTQRSFWMKQLVKVINLRSDRLVAQRVMVFLYFGLAVWGFARPFWDWVGTVDGWSQHSTFVSAFSYAVFWFVIGSLKFASYSKSVVTLAKEMLELLRENKTIDDSTLSHLQKRTLFEKLMRIWPKERCVWALSSSDSSHDDKKEEAK